MQKGALITLTGDTINVFRDQDEIISESREIEVVENLLDSEDACFGVLPKEGEVFFRVQGLMPNAPRFLDIKSVWNGPLLDRCTGTLFSPKTFHKIDWWWVTFDEALQWQPN